MKALLIVITTSAVLVACTTVKTGAVRRTDADYYFSDWRTMPSQKAFDVAAAPKHGMAQFIANIRYPIALRQRGIRGQVKVLVSLDSSGRVLDVKLVHSVDPVLDQIVVDAVYHTEWEPALKKGVPIPLKFYLPVNFS